MIYNDSSIRAAAVIVLILGAALFYRVQHPSTVFAADGIDPDWDAVAQRTRDAGQPAVVLFTANWCSYCRALHSQVLSRSDVQAELQGHYTFYTVDLSNPSPQVLQHEARFGVNGIPLLIRYDADGKETSRANFLTADQMMAWLKAGE